MTLCQGIPSQAKLLILNPTCYQSCLLPGQRTVGGAPGTRCWWRWFLDMIDDNNCNCEAQGKGRAKGRPRKVTKRSFIDGGWWMVDILSLMLYTKFGRNHIADCSTGSLNKAVLQWSSRLYAWSTAPPQVSLSSAPVWIEWRLDEKWFIYKLYSSIDFQSYRYEI